MKVNMKFKEEYKLLDEDVLITSVKTKEKNNETY